MLCLFYHWFYKRNIDCRDLEEVLTYKLLESVKEVLALQKNQLITYRANNQYLASHWLAVSSYSADD